MLNGLREHQEQLTQAHLVDMPTQPPESIEEILRYDEPTPVLGKVFWTWLQT